MCLLSSFVSANNLVEPMITVYSPAEKKMTEAEFQQLYSIITYAYASTEAEMWGENYVRVTENDFRKFIDNNEVYVAFFNDKVAGGLRYYKTDETTASFGLFGADFALSGKGVGRALINRVEEVTIKSGIQKIKIEILRPKAFDLPVKKKLHHWYQSLGYQFVESIDFAAQFPERAAGILVPCQFDYYLKQL